MAPGRLNRAGEGGAHGLADGGLTPQAPQQPPGELGQQEPDEQAVRARSVQARAHVDERQPRHPVWPLLGQGRGHQAPHGMPDHHHPARAEPVQRRADPVGVSGDVVPARGAGRPAVAEQVDADNTAGARQGRDDRVPPGRRARGAVDQQQGGRTRPAALHHMHVTVGKPHEPAVSAWIAGHVLCHRTASCRRPLCPEPGHAGHDCEHRWRTAGCLGEMFRSRGQRYEFSCPAVSLAEVTSWVRVAGRPTRSHRPRASAAATAVGVTPAKVLTSRWR